MIIRSTHRFPRNFVCIRRQQTPQGFRWQAMILPFAAFRAKTNVSRKCELLIYGYPPSGCGVLRRLLMSLITFSFFGEFHALIQLSPRTFCISYSLAEGKIKKKRTYIKTKNNYLYLTVVMNL